MGRRGERQVLTSSDVGKVVVKGEGILVAESRKDPQKIRYHRRDTLHDVKMKHEPFIREVTARRKEIADKINQLREEDKKLLDQQQERMKIRDEEVEVIRQRIRGG